MRLAYEQGLLTQKNLSYFQHWALIYWLYLVRRTTAEDKRAELIQQTFNLFPERWGDLYREQMLDELGIGDAVYTDGWTEPDPENEEEYNAINRFFEQQERGLSWVKAQELGMPADWQPDRQGIRV